MDCKIDYHIHSRFSEDSSTPTDEIVSSAIKKGLSQICFTEHKDLDVYYKGTDYYKDGDYSTEIERLKNKYQGTIEIRKGIELDFQEGTIPLFEDFLNKYSFDFVIASVHVLRHEFVDDNFFRKNDPDKSYKEYLEQVLVLSKRDSHDVVGHIDYVKRFGSKFLKFDPRKYRDILVEILGRIIHNKRGIELNTAGWRHPHGESYPSEYILKLYRDIGGEIITVGSDAHIARHVGFSVKRATKLLEKIGFDGVYAFKNRRPQKILF